jgi:hypothetical protein
VSNGADIFSCSLSRKGALKLSIDKRNNEGYYDPTAYEALSLIEKEEEALRVFRPIVFICSPYAGDIEKTS